jgi:hypothetical protein
MSMLDSLRKGFRFFLMSLGISSPTKKPAPKPAQKPDSGSKQ